jgi:hypothetical protein
MKTIWKYEIDITGYQEITTPLEWKPVHVGIDPHGKLCIWAEVEVDQRNQRRRIHVRGTGHEAPEKAAHIGSAVMGQYVWHVYA